MIEVLEQYTNRAAAELLREAAKRENMPDLPEMFLAVAENHLIRIAERVDSGIMNRDAFAKYLENCETCRAAMDANNLKTLEYYIKVYSAIIGKS